VTPEDTPKRKTGSLRHHSPPNPINHPTPPTQDHMRLLHMITATPSRASADHAWKIQQAHTPPPPPGYILPHTTQRWYLVSRQSPDIVLSVGHSPLQRVLSPHKHTKAHHKQPPVRRHGCSLPTNLVAGQGADPALRTRQSHLHRVLIKEEHKVYTEHIPVVTNTAPCGATPPT
jgi:hypothetical protein